MTEKDVKEVTEAAKQKLKESGDIYFDHILAYISYLESQIEKMKCCENCKFSENGMNYELGEPCYRCEAFSNWKVSE